MYKKRAVEFYEKALALHEQGNLSAAEKAYKKSIKTDGSLAEAYNNLADVLSNRGQLGEADACYKKLIRLRPGFAAAYFNRGHVLAEMGRQEAAVASYDKAIELDPPFVLAHLNRGNALRKLGKPREALRDYDEAVRLKPDFAVGYCNRGNVLMELGKLREALRDYDEAVRLKPDFAEAYKNRGNLLRDLGKPQEAVESYENSIRYRPGYLTPHSNLLATLNYIPRVAAEYALATAHSFGRLVTEKAKSPFETYRCLSTPERLKVGFVSGDLRNHPVGYFLETVLARINPNKIELIAYPTTSEMDDLSERIKSSFEGWKPVDRLSDQTAAEVIHDDGVHILLDLSGHSGNNRLPLFGWKPSPIQVSWLGYWATTGLNEMDYLIGDPYVTPPEDEQHFTETIWQLPETRWCFSPPDVEVEITAPPALKNGYVTFGCFNNFAKINNDVIEMWARVLRKTPSSRLLLKSIQYLDQSIGESVIQSFKARGIGPEFIKLEAVEVREKYFKAYNRVDIALDPFPFNGGTVSVEGLWMGVPVLTLAGNSLVSRQGAGIVMNAGLSDWIADDEEEYIYKATQFASNLENLATLRAGLRSQVLKSPVFDAQRFAQNFENALWKMWKRHQKGVKNSAQLP